MTTERRELLALCARLRRESERIKDDYRRNFRKHKRLIVELQTKIQSTMDKL